MVNGRAFDWEHLTVKRNGVTLAELQSIDFERSSGISRRRGKGRKTRGYTRKGLEAKFKCKLTIEAWDEMLKGDSEIKEKGLYDIDGFDFVLSLDKGNGEVIVVTLEDCVFTSDKHSGYDIDTDGFMVDLEGEILSDVDFDGIRGLGI